MTFKHPNSAGLAAFAFGMFATTAAFAEPTINKGDNAWMLTSTVLVLLMTIPGLALFYGGLVRSKNMLSVLMQVFYTVCIVVIIWALYGYSLAFTGGSDFIGGFSKAFLMGVTPDSKASTFSVDANISELVYVCFQMTFAAITPALIVGAFAERMKFSAVALFIPLWSTLVYFPIAHMVWYWAGPDAIADAVKALAAAGSDAAAKAAAEARLAEVNADAGWVFKKGAIDFAGGTVVHINAGIAGLVGALIVGKRIGYGKDLMAPHSLTMSMIGASLLWVGWFGFNAGSNLEATGGAALAMTNSFVATAAAALSWMFAEWILKGHPSVLGAISGAVAGLVAVTPAAGYSGPMGAIVLGLVVGVVCLFFVTVVKNSLGYDDSLERLRGSLHRWNHRRSRHRHPRQSGARRRRHHGLHDRQDRRLPVRRSDDFPDLGGMHHACVVGRRVCDHLQGRQRHRWPARQCRKRARGSRPDGTHRARLQHVSSPEGAVCLRIAPELRFGHIPGNAPTVEGLQRKLEPLSFSSPIQ